MRCNDISTDLKAYLDGEVTRLEAARIRHHLRHCSHCAAQLAQWQRLNMLLLDADPVEERLPPPLRESGSGVIADQSPASENGVLSVNRLPGTFLPPFYFHVKRIILEMLFRKSVSRKIIREKTFLKQGVYKMPVRLLVCAALTGALTTSFLMLQTRHDSGFAQQVGANLGRANTWHLHGWKVQGGKRVPWDIWGRRTPFFCREQVGSEILIDDGTQQMRLYVPDTSVQRKQGVALRTLSTPNYWERPYLSYQALVDARPWGAVLKPLSHNGHQTVFKVNNVGASGMEGFTGYRLYTVDTRRKLPIRYEEYAHLAKQARQAEQQWESEQLEAEYDVPLPLVVASPAETKGYTVIDTIAASAKNKITLPDDRKENIQTSDGFTVEATPIGIDAQNRIYIRIRGWLGGMSLRIPAYDMIDSAHIYDLSDPAQLLGMQVSSTNMRTYKDERGRQYLLAPYVSGAYTIDADTQLVVLALMEPDQQITGRPRKITLALSLDAMTKRASGSYKPEYSSVTEETIVSHEFTWSLDLTKQTDPALLADAMNRLRRAPGGDTATRVDEYAGLNKQLNAAREWYYMDQSRQSGPLFTLSRPLAQRAIWWMQRSASQSQTPQGHSSALLFIAQDALEVMDKPQAIAALEEIIDLAKRHPHPLVKEDAKKAHEMLRDIPKMLQHRLQGHLLIAENYMSNREKRSLAIQLLHETITEAQRNPEDLYTLGKEAEEKLRQLQSVDTSIVH